MEKYFNFNNEADLTTFELQEDGTVFFELGDQHETFDSVEEFAEFYAVARNVKPENLKNWVLVEDDDTYSFVLRAGTAGIALDDLVESLRLAGMTPEEIGQAIRAYEQETDHDETPEETEDEPTAIEMLHEAVEAYDGYKREILEKRVDFENPESYTTYEVVEFNDDDDYDEDYGHTTTYKEYGRDAIDLHLHDILSNTISQLKDEYPDLPVEIAWDILNQSVRDDHTKEDGFTSGDTALEEFFKASLAAQFAHRQVSVAVVTLTGEVSYDWADNLEYDDEDAVLYSVHKKFFIVPKVQEGFQPLELED